MKKQENNNETPLRLVPGRDYYVENDLFVFTAFYLKRRGYCCSNNCRHCPYPKDPPPAKL